MDDYLSVSKAAQELGRSRQNVWRHVELGRLRAPRIGRVCVIRRRDLAAVRGLHPGLQMRGARPRGEVMRKNLEITHAQCPRVIGARLTD